MSKAYSEDILAYQLDSDLSWRLRELSDLKSLISSTGSGGKSVLLRSLVAMLYAHWEGHIRHCAFKYFEYLTLRRLSYDQLERQIFLNSYLVRLDVMRQSRANVADRCALINDIMTSSEDRFAWINPALIDTRSNLSSEVLKDICLICSVDFSYFEARRSFIDVILLKRRNAIAHGEETYVDGSDLDNLVSEGIGLMRAFKDSVLNKTFTKGYLRPKAIPRA